jgi:uncharacterized membrane protein YfcA
MSTAVTEWMALGALAVAGVVAGALNVLAGGGSFLTLPLLLFLGLPAADANGTNRVGVVVQSVGAVWGFHRHRVLDWPWALAVSVPSLAGAALGTWAALVVPDLAFRRVLSIAMLAMTLWTLTAPAFRARTGRRSAWDPPIVAGFFIVGLYGGFLQAGIGFLILAVTSYAGLDLVRGNAVKMLSVLALTMLSLAIFASSGVVHWGYGLALGLGNLAGALVGVRLAVLRGHKWLQRVVTITVVAFAIALWVT